MIVVGLDLSLTSAGIAVLRGGELTYVASVGHRGKDGASYLDRSRRVRSQCQAVMRRMAKGVSHVPEWDVELDLRRIDLAVVEGPLHHGPQQAHDFDRAALWHGVFGALEAKGIPVAVINPMTLKVWWTGDGSADKLRMLDTARARFRPAITTHDEADAVALACAGAYRLGDPIPFMPTERQVGALGRVEWP